MNQGHLPQEKVDLINKSITWGSVLKNAYVSYNDDHSVCVLSLVIAPTKGGKNDFFHAEDLNNYITQIKDLLGTGFTEVVFQIWTGKE